MSFTIKETKIKGCVEVLFNQLTDHRGSFTKTYHEELFKAIGITMKVAEEYFTYSKQNVFRGLHFQVPPKALDKLVYCVSGQITDYVVDIRKGSPTYGQYVSFELNSQQPSAVFVPVGLAHGFYVKSADAMMQYKVSEVYDAPCDAGILYTDFDFAKTFTNPIISERDLKFSSLEEFDNPFVF